MTRTGKIALGVGVGLATLAAVTYFVSEAKARPPAPAPPLEPGPAPGPGQIPPGAKNYVGSGWTAWPHKDVFPDVDALVQAFRRLGYQVDDSLVSAVSMEEVGTFQEDYNWWWQNYGDPALGPEIQEYPAEPSRNIDQDELVGSETVEALFDALLADEHFPGGWPALVTWYEERT